MDPEVARFEDQLLRMHARHASPDKDAYITNLQRKVKQQQREITRLESELADAQQTARKHFQNAQNLMRYEIGKVEHKSVEGKPLQ